ncbi:hypothetical protein AB0B50_19385 [Streptomyces sp. NPDC041068]|uniref:hypothetical protein n=1 Tax=Streptomyces sp. NPDC041068 TaxID=3155130 RepID=UPI0033D7CC9D
MVEHFGGYDWSTVRPVAVSTTFTEELELTVGAYPVRLYALPSGHTQGDLFAPLPAHRMLATGAEAFVPVTGRCSTPQACAGMRGHIANLEYVHERAHAFHADGLTVAEAARRVIAERRRPEPGLPERLLVTIGSEYRGIDGSEQPGMVATMQEVVALAREISASR